MSVEENKKLLKRQTQELWIEKNIEKLDAFFSDDATWNVANDKAAVKKLLEQYFADTSRPHVVSVDYHEMIGEGNLVAARQTNHVSDGSTVEGVTVAEFKNGKITKTYWYTSSQD